MGFEDIMQSDISEAEKDKYLMISLICGIETKLATTENIWWLPEGREVGGWMKEVKRIKRCKFPVLK